MENAVSYIMMIYRQQISWPGVKSVRTGIRTVVKKGLFMNMLASEGSVDKMI